MTTTSISPSSPLHPVGALPPTPTRPRRARALTGALVATAVVAGLSLATAAPVQAGERTIERIVTCDATACLYAWGVVDSDGDGASDADEWMAGSDPYDASSRPLMAVLTDLLLTRQLPSFENGFAAMVVMPADLVAQREKAVGAGRLEGLDFDGFPIESRKDNLSRLGISADTMAEHGIDPDRGAFTLGLEHPEKDGGRPPIRVGGVDLSTISAGHSDSSSDHEEPPSEHEPHVPPPADPGDDLVPLDTLNLGEPESTLKVLGFTIQVFKNGTNVMTGHGEKTYHFPNGTSLTVPDKGSKHYENPDADDATEIDEAAFVRWERIAGATTQTVEGWQAPGADADPDPLKHDGTLIALIDGDQGLDAVVVLDEPRVTTPQPERHPGLPDPLAAAPSTGGTTDCPNGYCG